MALHWSPYEPKVRTPHIQQFVTPWEGPYRILNYIIPASIRSSVQTGSFLDWGLSCLSALLRLQGAVSPHPAAGPTVSPLAWLSSLSQSKWFKTLVGITCRQTYVRQSPGLSLTYDRQRLATVGYLGSVSGPQISGNSHEDPSTMMPALNCLRQSFSCRASCLHCSAPARAVAPC